MTEAPLPGNPAASGRTFPGRAYRGGPVMYGVRPTPHDWPYGWQWWTNGPKHGATSIEATPQLAAQRAEQDLREQGVDV